MSDDSRPASAASDPHRAPQPSGTPEYPDPAAPAPYPGVAAPESTPQYPGYTGPSAYGPAPIAPTSGPGGVAIAALVVGILAFLSGWVPIVGLILAVAGLVLGILALRQPRGKALGITAIVLSGLAAVTGVLVLIGVLFWVPMM